MRKLFLVSLLLMPVFVFSAEETPKTIITTFFSQLDKGEIGEAYDGLFAGSSIPSNKPQLVTTVKAQTQSILSLYGKSTGIELVREESITPSLIRLVYLQKFEKAPLTWEFYFYKPKSRWFNVNMNFNDLFNLLHAIQ